MNRPKPGWRLIEIDGVTYWKPNENDTMRPTPPNLVRAIKLFEQFEAAGLLTKVEQMELGELRRRLNDD